MLSTPKPNENTRVRVQELHKDGVHAVALTEQNFDLWVEEHDFTFVAFHAPWYVNRSGLVPPPPLPK